MVRKKLSATVLFVLVVTFGPTLAAPYENEKDWRKEADNFMTEFIKLGHEICHQNKAQFKDPCVPKLSLDLDKKFRNYSTYSKTPLGEVIEKFTAPASIISRDPDKRFTIGIWFYKDTFWVEVDFKNSNKSEYCQNVWWSTRNECTEASFTTFSKSFSSAIDDLLFKAKRYIKKRSEPR